MRRRLEGVQAVSAGVDQSGHLLSGRTARLGWDGQPADPGLAPDRFLFVRAVKRCVPNFLPLRLLGGRECGQAGALPLAARQFGWAGVCGKAVSGGGARGHGPPGLPGGTRALGRAGLRS